MEKEERKKAYNRIAVKKYSKKIKSINLKFSKEEYHKICEFALLHEVPPTTYCKILCLKQQKKLTKEPRINRECLMQINKIGVNINQIAYKINATYNPVTNKNVNPDLERICEQMDEIKALLLR